MKKRNISVRTTIVRRWLIFPFAVIYFWWHGSVLGPLRPPVCICVKPEVERAGARRSTQQIRHHWQQIWYWLGQIQRDSRSCDVDGLQSGLQIYSNCCSWLQQLKQCCLRKTSTWMSRRMGKSWVISWFGGITLSYTGHVNFQTENGSHFW